MNRLSEGGGAVTTTNATAHVYHEGDGWAVGGVLSNRDLIFATGWLVGVEGQRHLGNLVLEGEASIVRWKGFSLPTKRASPRSTPTAHETHPDN